METLNLVIRGSKGEDITEIEDILKILEIKAKSVKAGYSLEQILGDENLLKAQNEQLIKLGNTIDAYIDRVLKHKFWHVEINKSFQYLNFIYDENYENRHKEEIETTEFSVIKIDTDNNLYSLKNNSYYWHFICEKSVIDNVYLCENFDFYLNIFFKIDCVEIKLLENNEEIRNFQFNYLDSEFEIKLKDFILKLDNEIDGIIKKTIMPF